MRRTTPLLLPLLLLACSGAPAAPTGTPAPTATAVPAATPIASPTATASATATASPTATASASPSPVSPSPAPPATATAGSTAPATPLPSPTAEVQWSGNVVEYRDRVGERVVLLCVPKGVPGTVWGTDIYTDDSSVCTAALHSGLITAELGGIVIVEILPGQEAYQGSLRNGVQSLDYGEWGGSFRFAR